MKGYKSGNTYKLVKETVRKYYDELTFESSSSLQEWVVPNGITKIHIDCVASKGADSVTSGNYHGTTGGNGGRVECDLDVIGGQILYIMVGAIPSFHKTPEYNASDIRIGGTTLNDRVIVAGGGGSGAGCNYQPSAAPGGAGGGLIGANGGDENWGIGGYGGTQSAGGAGAPAKGGLNFTYVGNSGQFGLGGEGKNYYNSSGNGDAWSGAGGAGWYGGGSGSGAAYYSYLGNASGGGGSSYTGANCSNVVHTQGYQNGVGYIKLTTLNGEHFYEDVDEYKAFNI